MFSKSHSQESSRHFFKLTRIEEITTNLKANFSWQFVWMVFRENFFIGRGLLFLSWLLIIWWHMMKFFKSVCHLCIIWLQLDPHPPPQSVIISIISFYTFCCLFFWVVLLKCSPLDKPKKNFGIWGTVDFHEEILFLHTEMQYRQSHEMTLNFCKLFN